MSTSFAIPIESCPPPAKVSSWVAAISHLDPIYGGISAMLPQLCGALSAEGQAMSAAAFCAPNEDTSSAQIAIPDLRLYPLGRLRWWTDSRSRAALESQIRDADGVHIHGIWQEHCTIAASLARAARKPYLVSAHGMLENWAMRNKGLKKAVYSALIERRNLSGAIGLHALTQAEAGDYRRAGFKNAIAVIPNGVTVPETSSPLPFLTRFPQLRQKRLVLFLGRLHYKKGIDLLCRAWQHTGARTADAHLVIAGPDSQNTRAALESLVADLGLTQSVTFTGMLGGALKWSAFSASQLFVLPSHSEGLSISVLEALGMGLPSIVTAQCNLPQIAASDCGWVIEPELEGLKHALHVALQSGAADLASLGENGRRLIKRQYAWPHVARQMASVYQWALGGSAPGNVELLR